MENADVAAIVLGILLFLLIVGTLLVCCLYHKGILGREESPATVLPVFGQIHTTPDSLRKASAAAIDRHSYNSHKKRKKRPDIRPIIYLQDDIYHPPKSRPLPGNGVKSDPYPEVAVPVKISRQEAPVQKLFSNRPIPENKKSPRTLQILGGYEEKSSARHKRRRSPDGGYASDDIEVVPNVRNLRIRAYYGTRNPYMGGKDTLSKTF